MTEPGGDRPPDRDAAIPENHGKLPAWWRAALYGIVASAVLYALLFHVFGVFSLSGARDQDGGASDAAARLARLTGQELSDETLELMAQVPERVEEGRAVFEQYCVQCHLATGTGSVGPNLTDDYWLRGGSAMDIHRTITDGVPEKGMVGWESMLGPRRVQAVVAYLLTLRGRNLPGKKPEGDLWVPPDEGAARQPSPAADDRATGSASKSEEASTPEQ